MADKGIRCKLCGERHPGGVHVPRKAAFIPSPYDEVVTFIPDVWESSSVTKPVTKADVTKPSIIINGQVVLRRRNGRPRLGDKPMTPAERQRRHRERNTL